jgi:hypothetical protein
MSANVTTAPSEQPPFYRRRGFWRNAVPVVLMVLAFLVGLAIVSGLRGGHEARIKLPQTPATPKTVKLDAKATKDIHALVKTFVQTAVARKNLAESYKLIGPGLREGISLKAWKNGQVTAIPYPVDAKTHLLWEKKPEYSYKNSARLQLHVITPDQPNHTAAAGTETFFVDVIKRNGHWLVNNWVPRWTPQIPNASG